MRNKKGFTLVELLGVITVLGIIALIAIPSIDFLIGNNKEKLRDIQLKTIQDGLKTWGDSNTGALPENDGESVKFKLAYLKKSGFLSYTFEDPTIEGACFNNNIMLAITNVRGSYKYEVLENPDIISTAENCIDTSNTGAVNQFDLDYPAVVVIKGDTEVRIARGSSYKDSGAFLLGADGMYKKTILQKRITNSSGTTVSSISTTSAGTFTITYSSPDGKSSVTRKVIVE